MSILSFPVAFGLVISVVQDWPRLDPIMDIWVLSLFVGVLLSVGVWVVCRLVLLVIEGFRGESGVELTRDERARVKRKINRIALSFAAIALVGGFSIVIIAIRGIHQRYNTVQQAWVACEAKWGDPKYANMRKAVEEYKALNSLASEYPEFEQYQADIAQLSNLAERVADDRWVKAGRWRVSQRGLVIGVCVPIGAFLGTWAVTWLAALAIYYWFVLGFCDCESAGTYELATKQPQQTDLGPDKSKGQPVSSIAQLLEAERQRTEGAADQAISPTGEPVGDHPLENGALPEADPVSLVGPPVAQVRPWVRYWARMLDIFLFSLLVGFAIGVLAPSILDAPDVVVGFFVMQMWVFQESILLSTLGTTPGKWLLRTRVRDANGNKLSLSSALGRSFSVWLKGCGLGIPIISLVTLIGSRGGLKRTGTTSWDRAGQYVVTHGKIGLVRCTVVVILFIGLFLLPALGNAIEDSRSRQSPYDAIENEENQTSESGYAPSSSNGSIDYQPGDNYPSLSHSLSGLSAGSQFVG